MKKSLPFLITLLIALANAVPSVFASYKDDSLSDLIPTNKLKKNGAQQLLVRLTQGSSTSNVDKMVLEGLNGDKAIWSKDFGRYPNDYGDIIQGISAQSEGTDIIVVTFTDRGGDEIKRFRWDGSNIKFVSTRTDDRLTNAIKDIFKKAATCSRKEYGDGLQDMTEEIQYWWLHFSRADLTSLIKEVDKKALVKYQNHDLVGAIDRLYCGLDCAAQYGQRLALVNDRTRVINMNQAKPLLWLDSFASLNITPGDANFSFAPSNYINAVNNYAFYLQEQGKHAEAIPVFKKIISLVPDRAVTYLNLADSLWATGDKNTAKKNYSEYLSLVQSMHLKNIPSRITERAAAAS